MSIEDFNGSESAEGGNSSAEISEKYKESVKKAGAGIKRTQKDEKRAKKYDFLLAKFLVELILRKKYDSLLDELFACLDAGYGTNFLLGILSLVYIPISHEIRKNCGKEAIVFEYQMNKDIQDFDMNLPLGIQTRVNHWIADMEMLLSLEASSIITQRTLGLILYDDKIRKFTSSVFRFFFTEVNIRISESKSRSYSDFILGELEKTLKKTMPELQREWSKDGLEI